MLAIRRPLITAILISVIGLAGCNNPTSPTSDNLIDYDKIVIDCNYISLNSNLTINPSKITFGNAVLGEWNQFVAGKFADVCPFWEVTVPGGVGSSFNIAYGDYVELVWLGLRFSQIYLRGWRGKVIPGNIGIFSTKSQVLAAFPEAIPCRDFVTGRQGLRVHIKAYDYLIIFFSKKNEVNEIQINGLIYCE